MVLINSLLVLPNVLKCNGVKIFDNLQSQEILKLNGKEYSNIYSIVNKARSHGFIFKSDADGIKMLFKKTNENIYKEVLYYNELFSTTCYLSDLKHYWLCSNCMCAVPNTWNTCSVCGGKNLK